MHLKLSNTAKLACILNPSTHDLLENENILTTLTMMVNCISDDMMSSESKVVDSAGTGNSTYAS